MSEMIERVARAIAHVSVFSRFNDWTSDHVPGLPVEVCRYGADGEPEIVVITRFPATVGEAVALSGVVADLRARAAIAAMKSPTGAMVEAGAQGSKAKWGDHRGGKDGAERCWALMIASALGSESP